MTEVFTKLEPGSMYRLKDEYVYKLRPWFCMCSIENGKDFLSYFETEEEILGKSLVFLKEESHTCTLGSLDLLEGERNICSFLVKDKICHYPSHIIEKSWSVPDGFYDDFGNAHWPANDDRISTSIDQTDTTVYLDAMLEKIKGT